MLEEPDLVHDSWDQIHELAINVFQNLVQGEVSVKFGDGNPSDGLGPRNMHGIVHANVMTEARSGLLSVIVMLIRPKAIFFMLRLGNSLFMLGFRLSSLMRLWYLLCRTSMC